MIGTRTKKVLKKPSLFAQYDLDCRGRLSALAKKPLKRELGARGGRCRVTVCYHSGTAGHVWYESLVTRPIFGQPYQRCCGPAFLAPDDKKTTTKAWVWAVLNPPTYFLIIYSAQNFNSFYQLPSNVTKRLTKNNKFELTTLSKLASYAQPRSSFYLLPFLARFLTNTKSELATLSNLASYAQLRSSFYLLPLLARFLTNTKSELTTLY